MSEYKENNNLVVYDYNRMIKALTALYNVNNGEKIIHHLLGMFMAKLYLNTSKSYDPVIGPDKNVIYNLGLTIFSKLNEDLGLLDIRLATDYIYKYAMYFRNIMYHEYIISSENKAYGFSGILDSKSIIGEDLYNSLLDANIADISINTYNSIVAGMKYFKHLYTDIINRSI